MYAKIVNRESHAVKDSVRFAIYGKIGLAADDDNIAACCASGRRFAISRHSDIPARSQYPYSLSRHQPEPLAPYPHAACPIISPTLPTSHSASSAASSPLMQNAASVAGKGRGEGGGQIRAHLHPARGGGSGSGSGVCQRRAARLQ